MATTSTPAHSTLAQALKSALAPLQTGDRSRSAVRMCCAAILADKALSALPASAVDALPMVGSALGWWGNGRAKQVGATANGLKHLERHTDTDPKQADALLVDGASFFHFASRHACNISAVAWVCALHLAAADNKKATLGGLVKSMIGTDECARFAPKAAKEPKVKEAKPKQAAPTPAPKKAAPAPKQAAPKSTPPKRTPAPSK